ncbi:MAG: site-2 protease family protein [Planctomycetes bacterium]|nr:site-2 protease family protein [Planctomycetota bacterium]
MRGSWRFGRLFGIDLFIHWSFLILLGIVMLSAFGDGATVAQTAESILFVLAIFGCIVLHELGHALAARRFGIGTHDITLLPIGGVARLDRMPRRPMQELLVAIAGPAVNVAIAAGIFGGLLLFMPLENLVTVSAFESSFLIRLMWTNVFLVVFNLLPAFPMDGGRVLRSLLAMRIRYDRATKIAATIGQGMAIVFAVVGLLSGVWTLALVAVFVFLAARGEVAMARWRTRMDGMCVGDIVRKNYEVLPADVRLADVSSRLIFGAHVDSPVLAGTELIGTLSHAVATAALIQGRGYLFIKELVQSVPIVESSDPLDEAMLQMQSENRSFLAVNDSGKFVGLVRLEDVLAWLNKDVNPVTRPHIASPNTIDATAWQEMSRA